MNRNLFYFIQGALVMFLVTLIVLALALQAVEKNCS